MTLRLLRGGFTLYLLDQVHETLLLLIQCGFMRPGLLLKFREFFHGSLGRNEFFAVFDDALTKPRRPLFERT